MTTPLSDERIAEIRERCDKATPGPWSVDEESGDVWVPSIWRSVAIIEDLDLPLVNPAADRAFIAAARQDVPDLLAEVERLRKEVLRREIALTSLTPLGSEWCNDPEKCAEFSRNERNKANDRWREWVRRLNESKAEVARLRARVAALEEQNGRLRAMVDNVVGQTAGTLMRAQDAERRIAERQGGHE